MARCGALTRRGLASAAFRFNPTSTTLHRQEHPVEVYQILFLLWFIVFAFWLVKQFSRANRKYERRDN
jgi:flagellar biogenesis protein FliO